MFLNTSYVIYLIFILFLASTSFNIRFLFTQIRSNSTLPYNKLNFRFSTYLSGLVEGDGSIKVPAKMTSRKRYPSITIVFALKDKPLALAIAPIFLGKVYKTSGNFVILTIQNLQGLYLFANSVNGYFRTPKIKKLHELIEWLNLNSSYDNIEPADINTSSIFKDGWLSGMIDADGGFLISYNSSLITGKIINVKLTMRLSQMQQKIFKSTSSNGNYNSSNFNMMSKIAESLQVLLVPIERIRSIENNLIERSYLITVKSLASRNSLINYLTDFPLQSSKRLDYLAWKDAHNILVNKLPRDEIPTLKNSMNTLRTHFNWSHLRNILNVQ